MDLFDEKNIILEKDLDGKGMQNDESKNPFLTKAKEFVCLIKYKGACGTGFFCDIPGMGDNAPLTFLLTNNHVFPQDYSFFGNKFIDITINGNPKRIELSGRKYWTNSDMDFTCIEIKKEDNIKNTFSLDDNILKSNYSNEDYLNTSITTYALNKNGNFILYYSYGYIKDCKKWNLIHTCNTYPGCSGGCIVIENTNRVIGIHRGWNKEKNINLGIFIKDVIDDIKKTEVEKVNHYSYNLFIDCKSLLFYYLIIFGKLLLIL